MNSGNSGISGVYLRLMMPRPSPLLSTLPSRSSLAHRALPRVSAPASIHMGALEFMSLGLSWEVHL